MNGIKNGNSCKLRLVARVEITVNEIFLSKRPPGGLLLTGFN